RRILAGLPAQNRASRRDCHRGRTMSARQAFLRILPLVLSLITTGPASWAQTAPGSQQLTLHDAEQIALQNHPQIQAAQNLAQAPQARVTQAKSAYYPLVHGSATGSYAENDTRIGAGGLSSPRVFDRYGNGLTVNQLITDFGRTRELVKSSNAR